MRNIIKVKVTSRYKKSFQNLPSKIQKRTIERINIFIKNPFNPRLRTHPLSGKLENYWAFWIDYSYRIKFIFLANEEVLFLDIGTHSIYK